MRVFIFEVVGFSSNVRIAKRTKEEAIRWFNETYPTRRYTDIYEL
jgi:hypothetical protein